MVGNEAVGGANENVLSLVITYCPPYLSIWLMTWIILNISAFILPNGFEQRILQVRLHNANP